MNSSSALPQHKLYTGRVIMGCDTPGPDYITIQEMEGKRSRPVWDEATEAEYIDRCRERAQRMAREIIAQAQAQATREAEAIREAGRQEVAAAVEAARLTAQAELDAEFQAQAGHMAQLMEAIAALGMEVWQSRRRDFAALARTFTEKALRVELDSRRAEVLESLMDEAVSKLESHREFILKVAPEDYELAQAFMQHVQAARPDLGQWRIATDNALAQGGVVLETGDMLVDNTVASRVGLLAPYLEQLALPEDMDKAGEAEPSGA